MNARAAMTAGEWAMCVLYVIIAAGFFAALIIGERRERGHANLRRQEIDAGIVRLEHYANTGEARR